MMTKDELGNIVKQHIVDSLGYMGDELSQDRETALDYYFGRPMGNEQEGLSQVVSRDVADTVEWVRAQGLERAGGACRGYGNNRTSIDCHDDQQGDNVNRKQSVALLRSRA